MSNVSHHVSLRQDMVVVYIYYSYLQVIRRSLEQIKNVFQEGYFVPVPKEKRAS